MAKRARAMAGSRSEARRLADLDLFADMVKDVRKVQETSIGPIYEAIRKVDGEGARLADALLEAPAPRRRPRKRTARVKAA